MKTISATAVISRISTSIDGGFRLTLDIAEADLSLVQELLRIKKETGQVIVAFQEIENTEAITMPAL